MSDNSKVVNVDCREPKKLVENLSKYLKSYGYTALITKLLVGDVVYKGLCVERKSAGDFINSLFDRRLFEQINEMRNFEYPVLVIVGSLYEALRQHQNYKNVRKSVFGAISSCLLAYRIPVMMLYSELDYIQFICSTVKYMDYSKKGMREVPITKKNRTIYDEQEDLVASIDKVGIAKAQELLLHFKTVKRIANSAVDDLKKVKGIGEVIAKHIYEVMNTEYKLTGDKNDLEF